MKKIIIASILALGVIAQATIYNLNFTPSPGETSNTIMGYFGVWCYTNQLASNKWNNFGYVPAGMTNMPITGVPSPAYLAVQAQGTNLLLGASTNVVLYNTNALALIYTNVPPPPLPPPGTPNISN